jgi:exopolysaccharide biosynthesis WecB/TagA/CpsF family protein
LNILDLFSQKAFIETHSRSYKAVFEEKGKLVTFINPYAYLLARKRPDLFSKIDYVFFDGVSIVMLLRSFMGLNVNRRSFDMTSLAAPLFRYCEENHKTIFVVGTSQPMLDAALINIRKEFPLLNVIGSRNGFFNDETEVQQTIDSIVKIKPDYLIVGMGTPKQEEFLVEARNSGWDGVGFTCGGFIHQTASDIKYYPDFYDRFNIRWIYRIMREKHLRRRFIKYYPRFPFIFLWDLAKRKNKKQ